VDGTVYLFRRPHHRSRQKTLVLWMTPSVSSTDALAIPNPESDPNEVLLVGYSNIAFSITLSQDTLSCSQFV
jgi:hypothetical protein